MIWGKKKNQPKKDNTCLLLDNKSVPIARGELIGPASENCIQVRLTEGDVQMVPENGTIQMVPSEESAPVRMCKILRQSNDSLFLETIQTMGVGARENLRIPVSFESYAYPVQGGRIPIRAQDLSCGGIAFYTTYPFADRERFEIVIPVTNPEPLILMAQIIRRKPFHDPIYLYAAKFVDVINDEEFMVREAVFGLQLSTR